MNDFDENNNNQNTYTDYSNMSTRDYMNSMAQRANSQYSYDNNMYGQSSAYGYDQSAWNQQTAWNQQDEHARKEQQKAEKKARKKAAKAGKEKKNSKAGLYFKRGVAIVASAAIFGGVAGGVFNAISGDRIEELNGAIQNAGVGTTEDSTDKAEATTEKGGDIVPTVNVQSDGVQDGQSLDVSDIAENVMPSIVAINIKAVEEIQNFFGQVQQYETEGSGSGIIIGENDTELLIVTNNHVVSDAETVSVAFIDDEVYEAKVKSTDSDNDLAIIVVELKDLSDGTLSQIKVAKLGSSDELKVGEQVVAIGNALGYGQSVTTGIVSAKNRETEMNSTPLIQTDAAVNPGNSGGALLNMKGEVIGINSSKYTSTDVEGMCYAIPISAVEDTLDDLMNRETRDKVDADHIGYLGIACKTVSEEASEAYGLPVGVLISEVYEDSGAEKAGLKKNYIITKFNGQSVKSQEDLTSCLEYYSVGEKVEITYMAPKDDEYVEKTVTVTLGKRPAN
ncbi:MAG: S1C family serine protease [Wujia sp.]